MHQSEGRQTLRLALGAAIAGFAWAWLRHRRHPRRATLAFTQAAEWFVACGGAATLVDRLRHGVLGGDAGDEVTERVSHTRQTVTDRAR